MNPNHPTPCTWQPIRPRAAAEPRRGTRASIGYAGGSRALMGIRPAAGDRRGGVVPNGIVLKEGET